MAEATDSAKLHNKALFENLKNLEKHSKGFMYSYFDVYTATSDRMDNPLICVFEVFYKGKLDRNKNFEDRGYDSSLSLCSVSMLRSFLNSSIVFVD
ncbi:unnamed protein product [Ilex paraguariensis]|uniref:Uncharacterized protein n=1 Tax=Ilex paraguariensis TaxID=185542 RepID=A0ABC8RJV1_9AQUA